MAFYSLAFKSLALSPAWLPACFLFCTTVQAETPLPELLDQNRPYVQLPAQSLKELGWSLPDGGATVSELARRTPGSTLDPERLEDLSPEQLGYQARWLVHRYTYYGLEWDITALSLVPVKADTKLPTLAIIHGGSANWYEFFLDPLSRPGLAQYLAQKVPVLLITIPGNYKSAGWQQPPEERHPQYLQNEPLTPKQIRVRNSIFTFRLIAEGIRQLLEQYTEGPLLVVGHSTGGEFQFLFHESPLSHRLNGLSLGWGTGPPAFIKRSFDENRGARAGRLKEFRQRRVWDVRGRSPQGYVHAGYVGPLNPVSGNSPLEVAEKWFRLVGTRRPNFKQNIQDFEHQGVVEQEERIRQEIREAVKEADTEIPLHRVMEDLFAPSRVSLQGYRRMLWIVAEQDAGHWNIQSPEQALEVVTADRFRKANPKAAIRVLVLQGNLTHYAHIERPRQVAAALLAGARWLAKN